MEKFFSKALTKFANNHGYLTPLQVAKMEKQNLKGGLKAADAWKSRAEKAEKKLAKLQTDETAFENNIKTVQAEVNLKKYPKDVDLDSLEKLVALRLGEAVLEEAKRFITEDQLYICAVNLLQNAKGDC